MKTTFVLSIALAAGSLRAGETEPYRLTLAPQSLPTIPKVEALGEALDRLPAAAPKVSKRMVIVMRVVSDTKQLEKRFAALKAEAPGKTWESLKPEQRAAASAAATLAEKLHKEVVELRGELGSFPDPSRMIDYLFNAEMVLSSYDDYFSTLLHRQ